MPGSEDPLISIYVCTRNRKEHLRRALRSCFAQTYRPVEVLVLDDASTDGTEQVVRSEFPAARYFREEKQRGVAALRNRAFREAKGKYALSVDDDAYYSDRRSAELAVELLERTPGAAVVALPFIEPLREQGEPRAARPDRFRSFVSCAWAVRCEAAMEAEGFRDFFYYRGEERDLSIRLLDRGHTIVCGSGGPVVHLYSPQRDWGCMFPLGIRNNLLFDALNIPQPFLLPRMLLDAAQLLVYKLSLRELPSRLLSLVLGFGACLKYARLRRPVSLSTYRLYRSLPAHGPEPWTGPIPEPADGSAS